MKYQEVGIEPLRYQAPGGSPPLYLNQNEYQGQKQYANQNGYQAQAQFAQGQGFREENVERGVRDASQSPDAYERRGGGGYTPVGQGRY